MVSQDEVIDYVRQVEQPVTIKDIAIGLKMPWNESTRRVIAQKVNASCRYRILIVVNPAARKIEVTLNPEEKDNEHNKRMG